MQRVVQRVVLRVVLRAAMPCTLLLLLMMMAICLRILQSQGWARENLDHEKPWRVHFRGNDCRGKQHTHTHTHAHTQLRTCAGVAANPFWFVYELEWEALSESKPKRTMFRSSLAPPTYISIRGSLPACLPATQWLIISVFL